MAIAVIFDRLFRRSDPYPLLSCFLFAQVVAYYPALVVAWLKTPSCHKIIVLHGKIGAVKFRPLIRARTLRVAMHALRTHRLRGPGGDRRDITDP